ncbi:unnamed protein product [Diamesa serratosioi]
MSLVNLINGTAIRKVCGRSLGQQNDVVELDLGYETTEMIPDVVDMSLQAFHIIMTPVVCKPGYMEDSVGICQKVLFG